MNKKLIFGMVPVCLLALALVLAGCKNEAGDVIRTLKSTDASGKTYELVLNDTAETYTLTVTPAGGGKPQISTGTFENNGGGKITLTGSKGGTTQITINSNGDLGNLGGGNIVFDDGTTPDLPTTVTPEQKDEGWSTVTSLNQVYGTWKGFMYEQEINIEQWVYYISDGQRSLTPDEKTQLGNVSVTMREEIVLTFDANKSKNLFSFIETSTFSGGNIGQDSVWNELTRELSTEYYTIDSKARSVTAVEEDPIPEDELNKALNSKLMFISKDGKKIKMAVAAMGGDSDEDVILIKQ